MAEYTLTNTAAVVDASIQKVANATTTPLDGNPNMVTSGGVKAYVDDEISDLGAELATQSNFTTEDGQSAGYQVFPSGLKMAWGEANQLTTPFPSGVNFTVAPTVQLSWNVDIVSYLYAPNHSDVTTTTFKYAGYPYGSDYKLRYFAIGI